MTAAAEAVLAPLLDSQHTLRVVFSRVYASDEATSCPRAKVRNELRRRLLRSPQVGVDDHEFVALAGPPDSPCDLRRRSSANFEQSGEAGAVNHVWDASFQDYISNVRPSALVMFVASGAVPADAPDIFSRTSALAAGEAHYVLRVLGFPVVALSNTNPMSLAHGLVEVRA